MAKKSQFSVEDTFWGYQITTGRAPAIGVIIAQVLSYFIGACLLTLAIGMVTMPVVFSDNDVGVVHIAAAVLYAAVAVYLLWFASRGSQSEVHVDTSVGEIREVIGNRAGKPTTVGTCGFDAIGSVALEPTADPDIFLLVLQYHGSDQRMSIAEGGEAQLIPLRDRLMRDLMIDAVAA